MTTPQNPDGPALPTPDAGPEAPMTLAEVMAIPDESDRRTAVLNWTPDHG